jgi:para-nitrobenzyl esterase
MFKKPLDPIIESTGKLLSRRAFLDGALGVAGAAVVGVSAVPHSAAAQSAKWQSSGGALNAALFPANRSINAISKDAIVETDSGKVKGFISRGIYIFKGIPYGDDTSGVNRWTVAKKPKPWTGVRSSMMFGNTCPTTFRNDWYADENAWMFHWSDGVPGENCLRVNVWTPAINDNRKRPVMVWIHGGGYTGGSSEEMVGYDGENIARRGDIVIVSLNHRLNLLGFMNLEKYGEQYHQSANLSQLDIVAALEWVKTNISNFGGDPGQVTIFGQSGGGGKIAYLMGMPAAQGLFHRAISMSGSQPRNPPVSASEELTAKVMEELQITSDRIAEMQTIPYDKMLAASNRAIARSRSVNPTAATAVPGLRQSGAGAGWQPVVDGDVIPENAFYPKAPEMSKSVPLMTGNVLNEFITSMDHPEYDLLTWPELETRVEGALPGRGKEAIEIYRHNSPKASPFDIWSQMNATTAMRRSAVELVKQKAAQGTPAHNYWFRWQTPVLDGRPRAFHCSDIAFAYDNSDVSRTMTGGGDDARKLGAAVSQAFINFARTGDPNHAGLPRWDPAKGDRVPTMCFDDTCEAKVNPDAEELRITLST